MNSKVSHPNEEWVKIYIFLKLLCLNDIWANTIFRNEL
jgi:hypothetical protein